MRLTVKLLYSGKPTPPIGECNIRNRKKTVFRIALGRRLTSWLLHGAEIEYGSSVFIWGRWVEGDKSNHRTALLILQVFMRSLARQEHG